MALATQQVRRETLVRKIWRDGDLHRRACRLQEFYPIQSKLLTRLEQLLVLGNGRTMVVMSSRQTTKNEVSAFGQLRFLMHYRKRGGTWIRCAPTYKPQIVNSKARLKGFLDSCPIMRSRYKPSEGFMYKAGRATIGFFSADKKANVVGATADAMLDIDEAHLTDVEKYQQDFVPMTAWKNTPRVFWGVGGVKDCLLHKQYQIARDRDFVFKFDYNIWCELRSEYAAHVKEVLNELGGYKHPIFKTQYGLEFLAAIGEFFDHEQIESILDSDFQRGVDPNVPLYVVIDIGGEDRFDRPDDIVRAMKPKKDSTFGVAFQVYWADGVFAYPLIRIVDLLWRTGPRLTKLQGDIEKWLDKLKPVGGIIDARGLGNQIASYFEDKSRGRIRAYMATEPSVSLDCFDLLARVGHGTIKLFRDDQSPEWAAMKLQLQSADYELRTGEQIKMIKPENDPDAHIDGPKALTYLRHLVEKPMQTGILRS